ncbi:hypothetical protein GW17_00061311 [Ensete ventricosum]|nr:hypothetical protein GW17_00061311 [Ensete ventricosum]
MRRLMEFYSRSQYSYAAKQKVDEISRICDRGGELDDGHSQCRPQFSHGNHNRSRDSGLIFDNQTPDLPKIPGEYVLENVFQIDVNRSKWWDLSVLYSMVIIYRIIFFIMIKINEDVTPWVRGYIARRRMQQKSSFERQHSSADLTNRTPSLRGYVVETDSGPSSNN